MGVDERLPVIVGVGQVVQRPPVGGGLVDDPPSPAALIADAVLAAAGDAAVPEGRLLDALQATYVCDVISWRYPDPAGAVLDALKVAESGRERVRVATGGNGPQLALGEACERIARGEVDAALVAGGEAMYSRLAARKVKAWLPWPSVGEGPGSGEPDRVLGTDRAGSHDGEMARSLAMPTQVYPALEVAVRASLGRGVEEHQRAVAALWSGFSEVAADNPFAWSTTAVSADDLLATGPENRIVGFPYPKLLNANIQVDQAAAVFVCSVAEARRLQIPEDRWVWAWSAADAHDHWFVSERWSLAASPAIRACGSAALAGAGLGSAADVDVVDIYSCFPSAVEIAAGELGLPASSAEDGRRLTVTGGLTFGGGPGNAYACQSVATMTQRLRAAAPGSTGLCTALGWYVTKHAHGVYGNEPPPSGRFVRADGDALQAEVDAGPRRTFVPAVDAATAGEVEAYTVVHERDGSPVLGIVSVLLGDGSRTWANSRDTDVLASMVSEAWEGRTVTVRPDGDLVDPGAGS